jgi:hypothetical protein
MSYRRHRYQQRYAATNREVVEIPRGQLAPRLYTNAQIAEAEQAVPDGGYGTSPEYKLWEQMARQAGNDPQVEALNLILDGKGTFQFKCGGRELHKVVIEPNGRVRFPDHAAKAIDAEVGEVLSTIGQKRSNLPTCDKLEASIRAREKIGHLWSGPPGWAQALDYVIRYRQDVRAARNAERTEADEEEQYKRRASAVMLSDEDWRKTMKEPLTIEWSEPGEEPLKELGIHESGYTGDTPKVNLAYPDGWESFLYCRNTARHERHKDVVPEVRVLDAKMFTPARKLAAIAVCPKEGARPALLIRDERGWKVA